MAALRPLAKSPYRIAYLDALRTLGKHGKAALPTLKELLHDDTGYPYGVMLAIVKAAGDEVGSEITALLKEELKFWQTEGPQFAGSGTDHDKIERLNRHIPILSQSLLTLKSHPYPPSREVVTQLRDLWRSATNEANYVSETCDEVLAILDRTK